MGIKTIRAVARIQVIVEVDASAWGSDCSIGQLYKQATDDAIQKVSTFKDCRIVGNPKVIGVITEAES